MEINKRLVMTFKTTDDKKVSLSVDDPRVWDKISYGFSSS